MELADVAVEIEAVSRAYTRIHGVERSADWVLLKFHEEVGELTQAYLEMTGQSRTRDRDAGAAFGSEVADVLGQLLVLAGQFDVDVEAELEAKWLAYRDVVTDEDRAQAGGAAS